MSIVQLKMLNVSAYWMGNASGRRSSVALDCISLSVESSHILGVIGAVGSGKSTLLRAILGEMPIDSGEIEFNGMKIGYSAQNAWIFPDTVRQNIIFNQPYNADRYREVIKVTALDKDIISWENGDQTFVGDRGIILSGGQMARINLARCIYRDADIYLLDDPLSAVDVNVGRHIYETCIRGFLKEKAVILVTHQVHYLNDADEIIVMESGGIRARGRYSWLLQLGLVTKTNNETVTSGNEQQISLQQEKVVTVDSAYSGHLWTGP